MHFRKLRYLLLVHGLITLAAAVVLMVDPGLIPSAVGIRLQPGSNLVAYLLAGAEFGFAVLTIGGSRLEDSRALSLVASSCIAFHGLSGILEIYAYVQGVSSIVLTNVMARLIIIVLFLVFSRTRPSR